MISGLAGEEQRSPSYHSRENLVYIAPEYARRTERGLGISKGLFPQRSLHSPPWGAASGGHWSTSARLPTPSHPNLLETHPTQAGAALTGTSEPS